MIADELISQIRDRTDIVALIGEYVDLKQRGANWIGLCPFHNEKTPSFNVRRDRQFFHCFGCKESGDALAFLMRLEGVSFPQAARNLAERAGIEVVEANDREEEQKRRERARVEKLYAIMQTATAFYLEQRSAHALSHFAETELQQRGVTRETADAFRLGYAPAGWDALSKQLARKGHDLVDAENLGLIVRRRDGSGYYDRFRHRLMFPISDLHGQVVAFSGRILPPPDATAPATQEPKYVNSPEGPLYKKGELLYGLFEARVAIRRNGWAVLCEGNFDLVALHQAGVPNAVAPLGTAFTPAQAALLRRFAQRVTLMFDGDNAGRKAVHAALPLLRAEGLTGRVARLPTGDDPDAYIRRHGAEALTRMIDAASGIVEYVVDTAAETAGADPAERALAIEALGPVIAAVENPIEIELYIQRIGQRFGIGDLRAVKEQLRKGVREARDTAARKSAVTAQSGRVRDGRFDGRMNGRTDGRSDGSAVGSAARAPNGLQGPSAAGVVDQTKVATIRRHVKLPPLQAELVGVLLDQPELFASASAETLKDLLTDPRLRSIFAAAAGQIQDFGNFDVPRLLSELRATVGDEAIAWLEERLSVSKHDDRATAEDVLQSGIPLLNKEKVQERELPLLEESIRRARASGDEPTVVALMKRHMELTRTLSQSLKR